MAHACNRFIVKDNKFVRDFEGMYQRFDDPWQQRKNKDVDIVNNSAFYFLKQTLRSRKINSILDIGCAIGYSSRELLSLSNNKKCIYTGIDISQTVINKAKTIFPGNKFKFIADDIRILNRNFVSQYDLIFSSKTLYYVAPEIDRALTNIELYLSKGGIFCFVYNQTKDAFSNRWLTYTKLRNKLLKMNFIEKGFVEINRFSYEVCAIGIYQKPR